MKKILFIFLCFVFICSIVSCGNEGIPSKAEEIISTVSKTDEVQSIEQETIADYKQAYLDFLKANKDFYRLFDLVFIDNDDIPELYLKGLTEAGGDMVCSFKNGILIQQQLKRTGGGKYIERSGDLINQNGNMGYYYTDVYKLSDNGFAEILNALSIEKVEHKGGEEYDLVYDYFVEDAPVSEAEYNNALNSAFDFSRAVRLDENAVSYDDIVLELQNGDSAN